MLRSLRDGTTLTLMAIEFARVHILSRSAGHTAVKAAAYRAGEKLRDDRIGRTADYSHRASDVLVAKILLPKGADTSFSDRETLWNAVERREDEHNRRASAQLAKDYIIALPRELSDQQRAELAEAFARSEFVSKGLVVDMAIHGHSEGNPHAHLMTTTRKLEGSVFGQKVRELNGKFFGGAKMTDDVQLRHQWADFQNAYFKEHGLDVHITNNNGEFQPEKHLGAANAMQQRGVETSLHDDVQTIRSARAQAILDRPEIIINRVADKKAVFTRHDLYRELNKVVEGAESFAAIKAKLDVHESLVVMKSTTGREHLTTLETLKTEKSIREIAGRLAVKSDRFGLRESVLSAVLDDYRFLSDEQKGAVEHLMGPERLGVVVGLAGTGKSTMLEVVRRVNGATGHRVHGVALAGKAADELEKSSGISSRTILSFLYGLESGRVELGEGDVVVVDEAGMVSARQTNELLSRIESAGAKAILVGDPDQLQSIQTGASLRDLSQQFGYAGIETIRRQTEQWQRDATYALAKGRAIDAIEAYREKGYLHARSAGDDVTAIDALASAYFADERDGSKAVVAHRVDDVRALNERIRDGLKAKGLLKRSTSFESNSGRDERGLVFDLEAGDEVIFKSADAVLGLKVDESAIFLGLENGELSFVKDDGREISFSADRYSDIDIPDKADPVSFIELSVGERILFTRNENKLGVKNGQLGTLVSSFAGTFTVDIDGGQSVRFRQEDYSDIAYGYATTVHKSQGMTVDHTYVLGTSSMDKHLAYVALSRHRESTHIYTSDEKKFYHAVTRDNRQQTALDFAERHGLTLESEAHSRALDRIVSGQEELIMAVDVVGGTLSEVSYLEAKSVLEADERRIVTELAEQARADIAALEQRSERLEKLIGQDRENEPKPGFIKTRDYRQAHALWEERMRETSRDHVEVKRQIESALSGRNFERAQRVNQEHAARTAAQLNPEAVNVMRNYQADREIERLSASLKQIERGIEQAKAAGEEHGLPDLLKEKSRVLGKLLLKETLNNRLDDKSKERVTTARRAVDHELTQFKTRERGRGLGR